jgi:phosphoribosylglycinamide formyltransferase 1
MKSKKRLCIFASGKGSNFEIILKKIRQGKLQAEIALLVSNNPEARALRTAEKNHIRTVTVPADGSANDLAGILEAAKIDFIILAGYLRKIPEEVVGKWSNRIINIHPALLPSFGGKGFYGIRVHEAVIASGVKFSGVTVHFVNNEYDAGPIIWQSVVPVHDSDDAHTLQKRVLKTEHEIFWKAVKLAIEGKARIEGRRVLKTGRF